MTAELLAMFPNGLVVRCYDCSSLTQVCISALPSCVVLIDNRQAIFKVRAGLVASIWHEVFKLRQVSLPCMVPRIYAETLLSCSL
jgi:hypothetical protein